MGIFDDIENGEYVDFEGPPLDPLDPRRQERLEYFKRKREDLPPVANAPGFMALAHRGVKALEEIAESLRILAKRP